MISMDDGTFVFVFILLSIGFKVESDLGINASPLPDCSSLDFPNLNAFRASRFEGSDLGKF